VRDSEGLEKRSASQPGATPTVSTVVSHFDLKWQRRSALWNPFRVRVQISTWGGVHPHSRILLAQADVREPFRLNRSINGANTFDAQRSPRTSFVVEPEAAMPR